MKKNILVVDDSALMRRIICDIINSDNMLKATDVCRDGLEAYEKIQKIKYDAIVLDINMPRMDGLALLEKLQQEKIKATVIMVSALTTKDAEVTMLAMERGAVDFVAKPDKVISAKGEDFKGQLLQVLKAVLRSSNRDRFFMPIQKANLNPSISKIFETPVKKSGAVRNKKLVAIASSTGGPKALQSVIPYLPVNLDAPILLVQHMPKGFTKSMSVRLDELSKINVKEAEDEDMLKKGWVYIAPGGYHMEVVRSRDGGHKIRLNDSPAIGGLRPCANIMYESIRASNFDYIMCVVLTGMGADGKEGILSLNKRKPIHVVSQNAETCVVYGMPKAIAETGIVDEVVPLTEVAQSIIKNVGVN